VKKLTIIRILPVFLAFFCLAACSEPAGEFRQSGFLGDYSGFKPLKKVRGATGYAKPDLDLSGYDQIIVDPVTVMIGKEVENSGVTVADLQYLGEDFHQALVSELGKSFKIVEQPGPGVLHLRAALTDVTPESVVGMTSEPRGTGYKPRLAPPGEAETYIPVSHASMEMELRDSSTGERLAAIVDRKGQALSTGTSPRQAMKEVFDYWATSTEDILVSLHSGGKP
jgi:hypothetical protein